MKVVVVGDGSVGKSRLCNTCQTINDVGNMENTWNNEETYVPTIFNTFTFTFSNVSFNVFDTAGQSDFDDIRHAAYLDTSVFFICFSFMDPDSLLNVFDKWIGELKGYGVPVVMVGLKSDLKGKLEKGCVEVEKKQIEEILAKVNPNAYRECSSLTKEGVKELLECAIDVGLNKKREIPENKDNCAIL